MLANQIKLFRMRCGFSQADLAQRLHVVRQTVSKWEQGHSVPDAQMLVALAEVLGVTVAELLGGDAHEAEPQPTLQQLAQQLQQINACLARQAARRRRRMRLVCTALLVVSVAMLVGKGASLWMMWRAVNSASMQGTVTVIGGADGPTAIYVHRVFWALPTLGAAAGAVISGIWLWRHRD